ncbi:MAG: hypothetical protein RLZZ175_2264, partial [Bacteroidota bacterium]
MKEVNLISIIQAYRNLNPVLLESYFNFFNINLKPNELVDLSSFLTQFPFIGQKNDIYDHFYLGYTIPQISKEFDMLRIGKNEIINIEIKSINTG